MLLRLKTPVEIRDTELYKRLTIRINHQGVSVRDTEIGAKIGTKNQFRVRAGDFILSKIDARQGAFGIVPPEADGGIITGNFWTYRVDNQLADTEWFLQFTNSDAFLDLCKRSSTGNTHRKYLNEEIFLNHELEIPSLEQQLRTVVSCRAGNNRVEEVQNEITHQKSLLSKLKQAILQEAIQGKLTADWRAAHPHVEPARQLLQRIQAEKARLIAAKKFRPEKPLPRITPAEIPFEIPQGWEWCRLAEIGYVGTGATPATENKAYYQGGTIPWITSSATGTPFVREAETMITDLALKETNCSIYPKHTLLIAMYGQGKTRGQVTELLIEAATNQACAAIVIPECFRETNQFAKLVVRENYHRIRELAQGGSQPNLNLLKVKTSLVPLPPIAEQAAIVARVEALMEHCRELDAEIAHTRNHAAHLLQAVLKEAFARAS